jgi:hypothetical protein
MTSPIRCTIKSPSSPKIAKVVREKRIDIQTMIMNRTSRIYGHGIGCKNQELDGTEDAK